MKVEIGKYFEGNHKKLDSIVEIDKLWAASLKKCETHIRFRLKNKTLYGAHTHIRLGADPIEYYLTYAYDAILTGKWQWKDKYTLSQQLIVIVDSTLSTEVEKTHTKKAKENTTVFAGEDAETMFYDQEPLPGEEDQIMIREILFNKQVSVIEEAIQGDNDLENFWECIKEGMKRVDIAEFMERNPKQIDKLRERLIEKIKDSPYFEM